MMARQLVRLHKALQQLERQTWHLEAMWKQVAPDVNCALQAETAAPLQRSRQFASFSGSVFNGGSGNRFAPWEASGLQQTSLRRFTSSSRAKAAAEESGSAAKEAGKSASVPKAAASGEAGKVAGQQAEASTVAMRKGRMSGVRSQPVIQML